MIASDGAGARHGRGEHGHGARAAHVAEALGIDEGEP